MPMVRGVREDVIQTRLPSFQGGCRRFDDGGFLVERFGLLFSRWTRETTPARSPATPPRKEGGFFCGAPTLSYFSPASVVLLSIMRDAGIALCVIARQAFRFSIVLAGRAFDETAPPILTEFPRPH